MITLIFSISIAQNICVTYFISSRAARITRLFPGTILHVRKYSLQFAFRVTVGPIPNVGGQKSGNIGEKGRRIWD